MQNLLSAGLFPSFLSVTLFLVLTQYVEMHGAVHVFICLLVCELSASLPNVLTLGKIFMDFKHVSVKLSTTAISGGGEKQTSENPQ